MDDLGGDFSIDDLAKKAAGRRTEFHIDYSKVYYKMRKNTKIGLLIACAVLPACQKQLHPHLEPWDDLSTDHQKTRMVEDIQDMRAYRPKDCSDYVAKVLQKNGFDLYGGSLKRNVRGNRVRLIYEFVDREGTVSSSRAPQAGDIVFFSNTYDRNEDGRLNDALTHIGLISRIEKDGTAYFTHFMNGEFHESRLNIREPHDKRSNDYLRRRSKGDPPHTPYLSGQLFYAFGTLIKTPESFAGLTE